MALTTQQRIDLLTDAIYSGERSVTYDGRTVVYRDLDEMRDLLVELKGELSGTTLSAPDSMARRRTVVATDRDLGGQSSSRGLEWNR